MEVLNNFGIGVTIAFIFFISMWTKYQINEFINEIGILKKKIDEMSSIVNDNFGIIIRIFLERGHGKK